MFSKKQNRNQKTQHLTCTSRIILRTTHSSQSLDYGNDLGTAHIREYLMILLRFYEINRRFSYGNFHLVRLAKNVQVATHKLATELNPLIGNFNRSRCNRIMKLNGAPHLQCLSHTQECMKSFEFSGCSPIVRLMHHACCFE